MIYSKPDALKLEELESQEYINTTMFVTVLLQVWFRNPCLCDFFAIDMCSEKYESTQENNLALFLYFASTLCLL